MAASTGRCTDQTESDADAAIAAVQADVDQNESDSDAAEAANAAAIAVVQTDVNQNEADADAASAFFRLRLTKMNQIVTPQKLLMLLLLLQYR